MLRMFSYAGARRGWGSHDLVRVGERGGVLFCAELLFEKKSLGPTVRRGRTRQKRPRETGAIFSASRARRAGHGARARARPRGRAPGA